jgi:23S rRNA pseudouridine955/2504/2580 synthase
MTLATTQENHSVQWLEITEDHDEQRIDNYLITLLKGVPKSYIYRIIRKGEVRVNKGRIDVSYRLQPGDIIRVPPLRYSDKSTDDVPLNRQLSSVLENNILFEDDSLLIINKPSGVAVHGGSGLDSGLIECLRQSREQQKFLELVHRLDRDTSGCLLIAKKRSALRILHEQFRSDKISKTYLALLAGQWERKKIVVNQPLVKNIKKSGERMVMISHAGKASETVFKRLQRFADATLVEASPITGRTHQIRVHAAFLNHPIIGDQRYGYDEVNKSFKKRGYKCLFLHAETLQFTHPASGCPVSVTAPLPNPFSDFIAHEKQV